MARLYGMTQSPYTEKARWALDHHRLDYEYVEHVPLVGEMLLRRRAKAKKASVPLLVDGDTAVIGSLAIARHADRLGRGARLFPRDHDAEIHRWSDVSDRIIGIGRVRVLRALREDRAYQREALPSFVPGPLRGAFASSSSLAGWFLAKKHDVPEAADDLRPILDDVRSTLGGRPYLLADFSFADIALAAALHAVRPRDASPVGPATRTAWTEEAIAGEFNDLLMWRDALYAKHR